MDWVRPSWPCNWPLPELDGSSLMRETCEPAGTNRAITAIRSIAVQAGDVGARQAATGHAATYRRHGDSQPGRT